MKKFFLQTLPHENADIFSPSNYPAYLSGRDLGSVHTESKGQLGSKTQQRLGI